MAAVPHTSLLALLLCALPAPCVLHAAPASATGTAASAPLDATSGQQGAGDASGAQSAGAPSTGPSNPSSSAIDPADPVLRAPAPTVQPGSVAKANAWVVVWKGSAPGHALTAAICGLPMVDSSSQNYSAPGTQPPPAPAPPTPLAPSSTSPPSPQPPTQGSEPEPDLAARPAPQPPSGMPADDFTPLTSGLPSLDINCTSTFARLMSGFSAVFGRGALSRFRVAYKQYIQMVERDTALGLGDQLSGVDDEGRLRRRVLPEQKDAPWGLDMVDEAGYVPLDHVYHYNRTGAGVHVYIFDTGIRSTHSQFHFLPTTSTNPAASTRVGPGFSAYGTSTEDCHGHGTHVAAIVGGLDYGVAKGVMLHPVQVLDCLGTSTASTILQGLEWVAQHLEQPAVVHMSIEGGYNALVNAAVEELVAYAQLPIIVSAGNSGRDACAVSPASVAAAITVAAVDADRSRWPMSNWGACVDMHAPGVAIMSAISASDVAVGNKTGTSMAAPFVTGVVALYLQASPGANNQEVTEKLLAAASIGTVVVGGSGRPAPGATTAFVPAAAIGADGSPNRMLYSFLDQQMVLSPSVLLVNDSQQIFSVEVTLTRVPKADVNVSVVVPQGWNGEALSDVVLLGPAQPDPAAGSGPVDVQDGATSDGNNDAWWSPGDQHSSTVVPPTDVVQAFNAFPLAQIKPGTQFVLKPDTGQAAKQPPTTRLGIRSTGIAQGTYFIQLAMTSSDPFFAYTTHVIKVMDVRQRTGETAANARVIRALPFHITDTTRPFHANYAFDIGGSGSTASTSGTQQSSVPPATASPGGFIGDSPDVVYTYTPPLPTAHPATAGMGQPSVNQGNPSVHASQTSNITQYVGVTISTCGSAFDTLLVLASDSGSAPMFVTNDDDASCLANPSNSRIDASLTPGVKYYIILKGFAGAAGPYLLDVAALGAPARAPTPTPPAS